VFRLSEGSGHPSAEGFGEASTVEGIPMFFAFSRSEFDGSVSVVGMPKSLVLEPAWRTLWVSLALFVAAALIGSLFAFRLWRRLAIPLGALARQAHVEQMTHVFPSVAVSEQPTRERKLRRHT
jgi:hypothetical protein